VVATAVRGVHELLSDGRNALVVPPDDPVSLAAGLRAVLVDAELARRLAEGGSELVTRHTEEAMAASYLSLYGRLARDG
jgi:glycosyltransferase involved in cell wall biosynthesis